MPINCKGCYAYCCRMISCPNLDNNTSLCKIYENRPTICNTDKRYALLFSDIPREEYDNKNANACIQLKQIYLNNLKHDYLIAIEQKDYNYADVISDEYFLITQKSICLDLGEDNAKEESR